MPDRATASPIDGVRAAAHAYEGALASGDVDAATAWFDVEPDTSRLGPEGAQLGYDAVRQLRARTTAVPPATWTCEEVRYLGPGVVLSVAVLERGSATVQRTQVWVDTADGWRITHAHVSLPHQAGAPTDG